MVKFETPATQLPRVLDIPEERREQIVQQMAKAYEGYNYKGSAIGDPIFFARKLLYRVINGKTDDNHEWVGVPNKKNDTDEELLRKRFRIIGYDVDYGERLENKSKKKKHKRQVRQFITNESVDKVRGNASRPHRLGTFLSSEEEKIFKQFKKKLYQDHPGLKDSIVDELGVDQLAFQHIEILRAQGTIATQRHDKQINVDISRLIKQYRELCQTLGISRKQRLDQRKNRDDGTVADLVRTYQETAKNFHEQYRDWLIEEFHCVVNKWERGELPEWYVQYYFGNRVEFPTGNIVPMEVPWIREILADKGIVDRN